MDLITSNAILILLLLQFAIVVFLFKINRSLVAILRKDTVLDNILLDHEGSISLTEVNAIRSKFGLEPRARPDPNAIRKKFGIEPRD
jgi:hypothetical protein